jgi:hypothetical protein
MNDGISITYATSSALLTKSSGLEVFYANLGANIMLFLSLVGAVVVAFVFLVGTVQLIKNLWPKKVKAIR